MGRIELNTGDQDGITSFNYASQTFLFNNTF